MADLGPTAGSRSEEKLRRRKAQYGAFARRYKLAQYLRPFLPEMDDDVVTEDLLSGIIDEEDKFKEADVPSKLMKAALKRVIDEARADQTLTARMRELAAAGKRKEGLVLFHQNMSAREGDYDKYYDASLRAAAEAELPFEMEKRDRKRRTTERLVQKAMRKGVGMTPAGQELTESQMQAIVAQSDPEGGAFVARMMRGEPGHYKATREQIEQSYEQREDIPGYMIKDWLEGTIAQEVPIEFHARHRAPVQAFGGRIIGGTTDLGVKQGLEAVRAILSRVPEEEREKVRWEVLKVLEDMPDEAMKEMVGPERREGAVLKALFASARLVSGAYFGYQRYVLMQQRKAKAVKGGDEFWGLDWRDFKAMAPDDMLAALGQAKEYALRHALTDETGAGPAGYFVKVRELNTQAAIQEVVTRWVQEGRQADLQNVALYQLLEQHGEEMPPEVAEAYRNFMADAIPRANERTEEDKASWLLKNPMKAEVGLEAVADPLWVVTPARLAKTLGFGLQVAKGTKAINMFGKTLLSVPKGSKLAKAATALEKGIYSTKAAIAGATIPVGKTAEIKPIADFRHMGDFYEFANQLKAKFPDRVAAVDLMIKDVRAADLGRAGSEQMRRRLAERVTIAGQKYRLWGTPLGIPFVHETDVPSALLKIPVVKKYVGKDTKMLQQLGDIMSATPNSAYSKFVNAPRKVRAAVTDLRGIAPELFGKSVMSADEALKVLKRPGVKEAIGTAADPAEISQILKRDAFAAAEAYSKAPKRVRKAMDRLRQVMPELFDARFEREAAHQLVDEAGVIKGATRESNYGFPHVVRDAKIGLDDATFKALAGAKLDPLQARALIQYKNKTTALAAHVDDMDAWARAHKLPKHVRRRLYRMKPHQVEYLEQVGHKIFRGKKISNTAMERLGVPGYLRNPIRQWMEATMGPTGLAKVEGAEKGLSGVKAAMDEFNAGMIRTVSSKHVAEEARRMTAAFGDIEFVTLKGTENREWLRMLGKKGANIKGKSVVMPRAYAEYTKNLFPAARETRRYFLRESQSLAMRTLKWFLDPVGLVYKPGMGIWRLTTTLMAPAFHIVNFVGALGLMGVAEGIKFFNPKVQGAALLSSFPAAFLGAKAARALKWNKAGQTLGNIIDMIEKGGAFNISSLRFAEELGTGHGPLSWAAGTMHGVARVTGLKSLARITDNYQHLGVIFANLPNTRVVTQKDVGRAIVKSSDWTGNYNAMGRADKFGRHVMGFYMWNKFIFQQTARAFWKYPGRLALFERFKKYQEAEYGPQTPETMMRATALPEYEKAVGSFTAPPKFQRTLNLDRQVDQQVVATTVTPLETFLQASAAPVRWTVRAMGPFAMAAFAWLSGVDPITNEPIPDVQIELKKRGLSLAGRMTGDMHLMVKAAFKEGRYNDALRYAEALRLGSELGPATWLAEQAGLWEKGEIPYPDWEDILERGIHRIRLTAPAYGRKREAAEELKDALMEEQRLEDKYGEMYQSIP